MKPTDDPLTVIIRTNDGQQWPDPPVMTVTGAEITKPVEWLALGQNYYWAQFGNPTGNITVTVSGGEVPPPYNASLDINNLVGATAKLDKEADIQPTDPVKVTVKPNAGKRFDAAPTMTVDGATVKYPFEKLPDGSYVGTVSDFTKNAVVKVEGATVDAWSATLDDAGLKGGKAYLNSDNGFGPDSQSLLTIQFDGDKKVVTEPKVEVTGAQWKFSRKDGDNTYVYLISGFTGNATVKVTGEAKAADPVKPDIKVSGNGTHVVGSGGTLTFTCSLPLEDLIRVYVDGKTVDSSNFELKSGSTVLALKAAYLDTLAEGKHTLTMAYTGNRSAAVDFEVTKTKPLPTDDKNDGKGGSDDKIAKTGDPLDAAPIAGVAGIAAAALVGAAALRRKRDAE